MGITNIATIMVAISLSWLPSSCSKSSTPSAAKGPAPVIAKENNLGELTMTNNTEAIIHITSNKNCRIMPKMLDRKNVQLTLTLETKQANGKTGSLTMTQIVSIVGTPLDVKVGETDMSLTPIVVADQ